VNPFILPIDELTKAWKTLRNSVAERDDALQAVVDFWSMAPLAKMAYDPEALDTWPTPWEMINNNDWCINSIAAGMEFTLRLGGYEASDLSLKLIRDYDISDQMIVLEVDKKYWLNYKYRTVSAIPSTHHDVLSVWKFDGRRYKEC
jgi:hypothetical protein